MNKVDRLLIEDDLTGVDIVVFDLNGTYPVPSINEVAIVQTWVANGGGLLLLRNSNIVANAFGVTFTDAVTDRTDAEFGWGSGGTVWYDNQIHYQRDNFPGHEITNNLSTIFMPFGRAIFGEVTPIVSSDSDATPANATVVGATEYGAGRIIFADTTLGDYFAPFTNSGKFAINIFRWVSKQPINGSHFDFLDTDGDGLENIAEAIGWDNALGRHYTNDCDPDSDDDGISDGDELRFNTDPNIPISAYSGRGDFKSYDSDFILPSLTVADWRGGRLSGGEEEQRQANLIYGALK